MAAFTLGPLVSSWTFERVARDLLEPDRNLIGLYLDEVVRQTGATVRSERPRTVAVRQKARRFADEQLPALIIVCPGTVGEPERGGDGSYAAAWQMTVAAVTQATDDDVGRALASDLCCAAAGVLVQMLPRVDSRVVATRWAGEASDEVDVGANGRSRCIFGRGVLVTVQDVVCDFGGPPTTWNVPDPPISDAPVDLGDLGTVETVSVTVTPVEETGA
jgi:hypothetical protein